MAKASTSAKRKLRVEIYKRLLSYTCAHPECDSGLGIEAHHIRPLSKGGDDAFWNLISLCFKCHRTKKLHSKSEQKMVALYVFKAMHESRKLGFYFDEQEEGFWEKYKKAIREDKTLKADEKLVYENMQTLNI